MNQFHCCFCTDTRRYIPTQRIHVPLARKCTMGCIYCRYHIDSNITENTIRPGSARCVVSTYTEIFNYLTEKLAEHEKCKIIGVSGPGDPLENLYSLKILYDILEQFYPECTLCICTNGSKFISVQETIVAFSKKLQYLTITINTLRPNTAVKLYSSISNIVEAEELFKNQIYAIDYMKSLGKKVKINTVYIPGINCDEIVDLYTTLSNHKVDCFNLMPYIDTHGSSPNCPQKYNESKILEVRNQLQERGIPLACLCKQCRSDYCGY